MDETLAPGTIVYLQTPLNTGKHKYKVNDTFVVKEAKRGSKWIFATSNTTSLIAMLPASGISTTPAEVQDAKAKKAASKKKRNYWAEVMSGRLTNEEMLAQQKADEESLDDK